MKSIITTAETPRHDRSRHWHEAIADAYFPLDLSFANPENFTGDLMIWELGDVSLSRLASAALQYRRLPKHLKAERDEHFLITIPIRNQVNFSQCGQEISCQPGGFFLERSHEPYEFWHEDFADLWVMKVQSQAIAAEIRQPDRFCSMQFNAAEGAGGLFSDMLQHIPARFNAMTPDVRAAIGKQLIDLLVLSLKADERTLTTGSSSVRAAHLTRIEAYVRRNIGNPALDPDSIARACGLSTRYLHELFRDTNQTLGSWIRDQRLMACRNALADGSHRQTVAEIAYRFGFSDHAQFSRAFKAHFSMTPKEFRDQARERSRTAN